MRRRLAADFDVTVVGGGTAGFSAALAAAHEGARVALVEQERRLGGDCTFYGCVPSKALIELAGAVARGAALAAAGILEPQSRIDFGAVMARQRAIVEQIAADERDERFTDAGIEVIHGRGSFADRHTLSVDGRPIRSRSFVVAAGSHAAVPPVPGLDQVPYLTNRTIFGLVHLPERLLVLGGGAIGLELAQAFARFGSTVTVIELAERLLPQNEPEAGVLVAKCLRGDGVELRLGSGARSARLNAGEIELEVGDDVVRGDALLVATGRAASVAGLGLERIGTVLDRGYVKVDTRCRTSVANVYAAGDVTGGIQLTHVAAHEGAVAGRNAAGKRARTDERVVPSVVFVDPEVARVGITEAEALTTRRSVRTVLFPLAGVDRARITGRTEGFIKIVTAGRPLLGRAGGGVVVGAEVVGPGAGELIHEFALAMQTRMFAGRLAQTIHAYPTMSVAVQQAMSQLFPLGRTLVESGDHTAARG